MPKRRTPGSGRVFYLESRRRWCAQLYLPPGLDGKSHSWSRFFRLKREAEDALAKALLEAQKGRLVVGDKTTLSEYLAHWLPTLGPTVEAKWLWEVTRYAGVIEASLGKTALVRLSPSDCQRFASDLVRAGRSPSYVQKCVGVLKHALKDAQRLEIIPANPAALAKLPKVEEKERQVWTPDELRRFLAVAESSGDRELYLLAILSGARAGELMALEWSDVDWERSALSLNRAVSRVPKVGIVVTDMKTRGSHRLVAIPALGLEALRRQRSLLVEWSEHRRWRDRNLVFPKHDGSHRTADHARRNLQVLAAEAGLPVITFHDLRHLHASLLLLLGADPKTLQQRLGHSSIGVTMDRYSHLIGGQDQRLAERLGEALDPQANR